MRIEFNLTIRQINSTLTGIGLTISDNEKIQKINEILNDKLGTIEFGENTVEKLLTKQEFKNIVSFIKSLIDNKKSFTSSGGL